jgi:hypothetical protein
MTWRPTCGAEPCILPSFCEACRKADARRQQQEPPAGLPDTRRAAETTVEALMYSLRQRGVRALDESDIRRRMSELDDEQAIEVARRLLKPKLAINKAWTADDVRLFAQCCESPR